MKIRYLLSYMVYFTLLVYISQFCQRVYPRELSESYRKTSRKYLYYISTDGGIISHYQDLEHAWVAANSVNRRIIAVGFQSLHYPGIVVSLCDIFQLPANITCTNIPVNIIMKENDCVYTSERIPIDKYGWSPHMKKTSKFNYQDVECIAGPTYPNIGISHASNHMSMLKLPIFKDKYSNILPTLKHSLGIVDEKEYATVHWRRGDQLRTRCMNETGEQTTANCKKVSDFVDEVDSQIDEYVPSKSLPIITYIATNENKTSDLSYLKQKKYKLFSKLQEDSNVIRAVSTLHSKSKSTSKSLSSSESSSSSSVDNNSVSPLDTFVLELMLMIDSTYFFAWGDTSVDRFVYRCRYLDKAHKHVSIFDGIDYSLVFKHNFHQAD